MRIAAYGAGRRARQVIDALLLTGAIVTAALSRRGVQPLGDEGRRPLPGDELLPAAKVRWTHAITVRARPEDVWPWLVQMGCGRAGWYSYDGLDNGGVPSAPRILGGLQHIAAGDVLPWSPTNSDGFIVQAIEPGRALVLGGDADSLFRITWAFVLQPIDETRTRLITRSSGDFTRLAVGLALHLAARPVHFGMQRKQLLNLKRRAEATAASRA